MLNGPSATTSELESSPYKYRWERLKTQLAAELGEQGDPDMTGLSMVIVSNFEIMVKRGDSEVARIRCVFPRVARCYMSSGKARSF
jgi:hypothetical protein